MTQNTPGRYGARPYTDREMWGAFALLALFGLPFAAGGVFALTMVPAKWALGDFKSVVGLVGAGVTFSLVGFGLMFGSLYGRRKVALDAAAAFAHPDEPWKWRADWAQGHALDGSVNAAWGIALFAVIWNLVAFPGGLLAWQAATKQGQPYAAIALLFPAVGIVVALLAAQAFLRHRRYGVSRFDLAVVPVPVGRTLSGTVRTRLTTPPTGGFTLTLSALRITRTGTDNDTRTSVVWQEDAQATGTLSSDGEGVRVVVPVAIRIPAEAPSTDHSDASDELSWKLEVKAATEGLDYRATFEVPVYRTEESGRVETAREASHLRAVAAVPFAGAMTHGDPIPSTYAVPDAAELRDAPRPEPRSAIAVTREAGALVIDYPAARNPTMALAFTGFGAIWSGSIVLMIAVHAPLIFPIFFGLFDLLFGYIVLVLWCEVVRVRVNAAGVRIAKGLGSPGAERLFPASEIEDVRLAIGMTSGTTAYYDVKLMLRGGRSLSAGGGIRHKHEAEWIAAQVLAALRAT